MDIAFIFGTTGNLSTALGPGWSVEDGFAWAIGTESQLTLPLHGNDTPYVLRFDLHPARFPPKVVRQRLMVRAGKTVLGSFELTDRDTIAIPLPLELTSGMTRLDLTLIHPDAVQPRDYLATDDSRRLAVCFHSASLTGPATPSGPTAEASDRPNLEPIHGIIAGDSTARRICEVISKLPCLKRRFGIRFLDLSQPVEQAVERLYPETPDNAQFCWLQLNGGTPERRDELRELLSETCVRRTFYAPVSRSLWPFEAADKRAVFEPGRYNPSRYPYGDRLAQALVAMNMPDDVIYMMYDMAADQDPVDLDEIHANDLRRWRAESKKSDMQLAAFIERHLTTDRIFVASNLAGPWLLREMVRQLLADAIPDELASPRLLSEELDRLLDGYTGQQEEIPVHKRVAAHFSLGWWSPAMKYRWKNNLRTYREYILDYIKWVQWRP